MAVTACGTQNLSQLIGKYFLTRIACGGKMVVNQAGGENMAINIGNKTKVTISVDPEILSYVDKFAKENGIGRSGAFCVITRQYKTSMESMSALSGLVEAIKQQQMVDGGLLEQGK